MNSLETRVRNLETKIIPKPKVDHVLGLSFGPTDEPHGPYGYRKYHFSMIGRSRVEPYSMEEEIATLKHYYENDIPEHAKRKHEGYVGPGSVIDAYSWATLEEYLESYRCKCGKHGATGLEPYRGEQPRA